MPLWEEVDMAVNKRRLTSKLKPLLDIWEWRSRGLCSRRSPKNIQLMDALFYAQHGERPSKAQAKRHDQAKAICAMCPVLEQCREHALKNDERFGIWGGLTEKERAAIKRQREAAPEIADAA